MKNAAELVDATHAGDGRDVGIDNAGQLGSRARLADHAQAAQSIVSILLGGGGDHMDKLLRSTSMKLVCESVHGLIPGFRRGVLHAREVIGRGTATSESSMRAPKWFIRLLDASKKPPP